MLQINRFILLVVLVLFIGACGAEATPTPAPTSTPTIIPVPSPTSMASLFPLTLTDSNGKEVIIEKPPERIVAFDSDSLEILFAIGEGSRIIGTHEFVDYPPEAANIERVGNAFALNLEKIVELEPDLVYIFFDRFVPDLENLGLKVLYLKSLNNTFQDVMNHFLLWGQITGNIEAAEEQVARFQTKLATLEDKLANVKRGPRVYHHTFDFWTPGGDTLVGRIYELLKADFVTNEISGYIQISPEDIVAKDPEVIVVSQDALDQVLDNAALQRTAAVKNNRVGVPQRGSLSVTGPRLIEAIEELAELLYPDLFLGES